MTIASPLLYVFGFQRIGVLLAVCIAIAAYPVCAAETAQPSLGTLLFTPAQRIAIVKARHGQGGSEAEEQTLQRFSGVVRRSDGKGTVWLNDDALPQGGATTPRLQGLDAVVGGRRLRVGDSINTTTGERTDLVAPGAVKAGPAKGGK